MLHLKALFAAIAIFEISASLPIAEKIEPVDLAYECIEAEADKESQDLSPIVLIHGLGGNRKNWIGIHRQLAELTKRKVCAIDLRNHGDSPWNNRSDIAALEVDLSHFLDTQGIKKVNLIGHSLGGILASDYTLDYPKRVHSLIIEDMNPFSIDSDALEKVRAIFDLFRNALFQVPEGLSKEEAQTRTIILANKELERWRVLERIPMEFASGLDIILVNGKWRFKFNIKKVIEAITFPKKFLKRRPFSLDLVYRGPVMFIYGTESPFKVWQREGVMKWLFPTAQMVPVEGANHFVHGQFPREFIDAVTKFLNKTN